MTAFQRKKLIQLLNQKYLILLPSAVHRLLSERLLCGNEAILVSYPFLGFQLLLLLGVGNLCLKEQQLQVCPPQSV